MKIVHITTGYHHGGAGIACKRLVEAQRSMGLDAHVLTQERGDFPEYVHSTTHSWWKEKVNLFFLALEKLHLMFYEKTSKNRFRFSTAKFGNFVSGNKVLEGADIIHLHWYNASFISLTMLNKIIKQKAAVVCTMHDIWTFTGGCHYIGSCLNYRMHCGNCAYLKKPSPLDLSVKTWKKKQFVFNKGEIQFVAPSRWMKEMAKSSGMLAEASIHVIPNTIGQPPKEVTKETLRASMGIPDEKKIILFGAFNLSHEGKGSIYLRKALAELDKKSNYVVLLFGKASKVFDNLGLEVISLGYVSGEKKMREYYGVADVFVTPSIEDNLPNTVLESLSLGIPVVAFDIGGMPDMIEHKKNGYLARAKDVNDLKNGIQWVLNEANEEELRMNAIATVESKFSNRVVVKQFEQLYTESLKDGHSQA